MTPRVPVTLRGRRFVNGKLRVRVLGTAPWTAQALGVRAAPVRIAGDPEADAAHDRQPGRRRPRPRHRHAAPGERRHGRRPAARRHAHARTSRTSRCARGRPGLAAGGGGDHRLDRAAEPLARRARRERPRARAAAAPSCTTRSSATATSASDDLEAVYAFQKVERLARTGGVDAALWSRIVAAHTPLARYGGDHVEIDKTRQVLFVVRGGKVTLIVATLDRRDGQHAARHLARLPQGRRLRLGPLLPELLPARLRRARVPRCAPVPRVARLRAHPDVDRADGLRADRLRLDGIRVPMSDADARSHGSASGSPSSTG